MGRLLPLGQVAARWYPGSSRMLAAAQSRVGAYEEADRTFQQAAMLYRLRADDWLFSAIAYHGLGDTDQAHY